MIGLQELQQDKHLRRRLIFICLTVALVVSVIYSTVTYRLSKDLGIEIELQYLEKRAAFILAEINEEGDKAQARITQLISASQQTNKEPQPTFILVYQNNKSWSITHGMPNSKGQLLLQMLQQTQLEAQQDSSSQPQQNAGVHEFENMNYIWSTAQNTNSGVTIISTPKASDDAMLYISKRLSITSGIVFWIAVWLALTLSSWIAKRVNEKNKALQRIATHDHLTGLPNRLYLIDNLQAKQKSGTLSGALLVIDLNHFKEVNDSLGHSAGDQLLIELSQRLQQAASDEHLLARTGSDEFLLWAPDINKDDLKPLAKKLIATCNEPILINQLTITIGACIGIAQSPEHSEDIEALIVCADTAMNEAKQKHSSWSIYDESSTSTLSAQQRLRYRSDLNDALSKHQIELYYQAKVNICDGKIVGAEALARWQHPIDGLISPALFIPLLEQSGFVKEFGRYVIKNAIAQLAQWQQAGKAVPVAINLSPYNLMDSGIVAYTQELLDQAGVSSDMLEIELTETSTSLHLHTISDRLEAFKAIGVKLSIDDFGTGMSSLAYISSLNVDTIKIDRSFIQDLETNNNHLSIVQTALTLAQTFHSKVVAEGVENKAQAELLKSLGCQYGQGFYYAKPMPAKDFFKLYNPFTSPLG